MEALLVGAALLNLYALILVLIRAPIYRVPLYRPMLWNIWLSVVPILILGVGGTLGIFLMPVSLPVGVITLIVTGIVWLLALPNASYLITELNLSHRDDDDTVPLWFDIILVITLAMSGVINTTLNVFLTHLLIAGAFLSDDGAALYNPIVLIFVGVVLVLLGLGMYLGRYPRFNSWDVKHPVSFVRKLRQHFSDRKNVAAAVGFTFTYAIFLGVIYITIAGSVVQGLLHVERIRELLS